MDFESVLELTAAILAEHGQAAAEVRDRYRYFVIDEYQDVNPLQKLLLDSWAGDRDDVCVVGDPRQTIYSFAGATAAFLTGFTAEFPDATVIELVRNYRSTPQVLALANQLTGAAGPRSLAEQLRAAPGRIGQPDRARPGGWPGGRASRGRPRSGPGRAAPGGPGRRVRRVPGRGGGGRGGGRAGGRAARRGAGTGPDGGAGPDQRPDAGAGAGAGRAGSALPGPGSGAVLRPARGTPGDRIAPRRGEIGVVFRPAASRRRRYGTSWPGWGSPGTPRPGAAPPGSGGSPWRRWPSWPRTTSRPTRRPA